MLLLLGMCLIAGFGLLGYQTSLEGILWTGVILSAAFVGRWHGSSRPLVTICAGGMAVLLGSLALVAP